ncbi:DUF2155 domain-containing protein [Erythrobacter sp. R86502]|uniref:DUF2155 domain-containing protein n=1 Tax=Erythrobacter sp. R86502 TaxID=3093846 RepID=UPI0036D37A33
MRAYVLATAMALAACDAATDNETVVVPLDPSPPAAAPSASAAPAVNDYGATPMNERVAVIGLLNKRNNVSEEVRLKPGESRTVGPVIVRVSACERTAPWEMPQQTGAFVQVDIQGRSEARHRRVFSGWLFVESPSLNVVEHPIYDVWVKDCTMRFPGEEGSAAPAPEPSGRPAARPSAATTPAAEPAPAPAATPAPDA